MFLRALGFVSQDPAFGRHVLKRLSSSSSGRYQTPYTLNDSVCPPTDRDVLRSVVSKHFQTLDRYLSQKPIAAHTLEAFEKVASIVDPKTNSDGIILDSGCGTARSTVLLGKMYPDHVVIGVDRSLARLNRNVLFRNTQKDELAVEDKDDQYLSTDSEDEMVQSIPGSPNVVLVRAELSDFWRCCLDASWKPNKHFMLYPNPYPKKSRLKSRWYAHPAFPLILQLGGDLTLRSNWEGYLKEFALSIEYANDAFKEESRDNYAKQYVECAARGPVPRPEPTVIGDEVPWTNFEKKYYEAGEPVYELELFVSR